MTDIKTSKGALYGQAYPIIKLHREHGRTISIVLLALCLILLTTWLKSTHDLKSALDIETDRMTRMENQLEKAQARVSELETNAVLKDKKVELLSTITSVSKQQQNYPKYDEASDEGPEDVIQESEEIKREFAKLDEATPPEVLCPGGKLNPEMFSDAEEFKNSGYWTIPRTELSSYDGMFWGTRQYEITYAKNPPKMHVPHLNRTISQRAFVECFMNPAFPVIINMERLRPLGFTGKGYTLEEMKKLFPTTPKSLRTTKYKANGLHKGTPDLGPALAALSQDATKKKMGAFRNYPRNMKLTRKAVQELGLEFPPYHNPRNRWQLSTMFMGATSADTPMHCDCCDNFCQHIVGTKRWILAPPTEGRFLRPKCFGGLCWAKSALPMHPTIDESTFTRAEQQVLKQATYVSVDVHAGEILFLPAGWYHAVYNLDPTVSLISWVSSGPSQLYVNQTGLTGGMGPRRNQPCLPNQEKC